MTMLNVVFLTTKIEYKNAAVIKKIKSDSLSIITMPIDGAIGIFNLLFNKKDLINSPTLPGVNNAQEIPIAWIKDAFLRLIL